MKLNFIKKMKLALGLASEQEYEEADKTAEQELQTAEEEYQQLLEDIDSGKKKWKEEKEK